MSVCPVVTLSWKSRIAMFCRRHMHSSECCHYFYKDPSEKNIISCILMIEYLCPLQTKFGGIFESVCLSRVNLTLVITFEPKRDGTFILHMCILCGKTFVMVPKILTLTLAITFKPWEIEHSYYTYVFSMARPLCCYHKLPVNLTWTFKTTSFEKKKLNLGHNLLTEWDIHITRVFSFCQDISVGTQNFDFDFSPTFGKYLTLAITFEPKEIWH